MKKFILFLAFISIASAANAQFMNTEIGPQKKGQGVRSSNSASSYSTWRITYTPANLVSEYDGKSSSQSYNGLGLTYSYAVPFSESLPIFLGMDLGFRWLFDKDSDSYNGYDITSITNFFTLFGSVNMSYRLTVPGSGVVVEPLVGLDLPVHLSGKTRLKYDGRSETSDIFKDNDNYRAVNFDWHIGAKVLFDDFFVQIAYESPIAGLMNKDGYKAGFKMTNLSIGFEF